MTQKLDPELRDSLRAAGDAPIDLIIRTEGKPGQYAATLATSGVTIRHTFNLLPGLAVTVPASAILALANEPWIVRIEPDREVRTM